MDLTTLKRNLSKGRIHTMAEFQRDLMLMFQNAVMYNDSNHHIYHMAVEMQREVLEQIQVLYNSITVYNSAARQRMCFLGWDS